MGEWGAEVIKIEPALKKSMNPADGDMILGAGMARAIVNGDPYPTPKRVQLPSAQPFKCADGKWVYLMGNDWLSVIDGFCKIMDMPADANQK